MEMEASCGDMEFSMKEEEGDNMVEGMATFRYLGRTLYQMDDDCPDVRRNIMHARFLWGVLGTLIRQEGADLRVAAIFYRAVVQEILLYGLEMWSLLAEIEKKLERPQSSFIRKITGKRALQIVDGTW